MLYGKCSADIEVSGNVAGKMQLKVFASAGRIRDSTCMYMIMNIKDKTLKSDDFIFTRIMMILFLPGYS